MRSEELLREAAAASFDNASALYEEATLLYERDKFARAAALAVLAAEEFAKSIIYLVAACSPEQRHLLPPRLEDHGMKHRAGDAAEAAKIMNEDWWAESSDYPASGPVYGRLADMAVLLCDWGLSALVDKKEAAVYYSGLRRRHKEAQSRFAALVHPDVAGKDIFISMREPDLKNAAIYVDVDDGRVLTPGRIGDREARLAILGVEWFLETYHALPEAMRDEGMWSSFSTEVRGRVTK